MEKARKLTAIVFFLGLCLFAGTVILGYWKITGSSGNILTMGAFRNQIEERYQIPERVNPGQTVDKVVNVKNTGTVDSRIRVRIRKLFGEVQPDGTFLEDPSLDGEMIQIHCNTTSWLYHQDGYYYYKDVLKAGSMTKEPLFQSYTLSAEAGNEYKTKEARILVLMESIQAQDAWQDVWNVSIKELAVTEKDEESGERTEVVYLGQRGGFRMTESDTDLFASFKNLTPGCARIQTIVLKNQSSEEIQLYLRAENAQQKRMDERTQKLVQELLEKYAIIEITGEQGRLYYGPVSGNLTAKDHTMREDIYLGTLRGGENRKLQVKLVLSEEMKQEFCQLTGKVRWVFTAKGEDDRIVASGRIASTGDHTAIGMWIALLGFSALFLTAAFALERSYSRKEDYEADKRNP